MRFLLLSDLHFEFHRDLGQGFVDCLPSTGIDAVVLAGDITIAKGIPFALNLFCKKYPEVVYVLGNHEYYGSSAKEMAKVLNEVRASHSNLHVLDKDKVTLKGVRFLGAPLWFAKTQASKNISDFYQIRGGFTKWVYQESDAAVEFFRREICPGDVVITHHLPSFRSVHPRYAGHPTNAFFVRDVEDIVRARNPAVWVHGHTHHSMDYQLGQTRVLCNPFGYLNEDENARFLPNFVVEVTPTSDAGLFSVSVDRAL